MFKRYIFSVIIFFLITDSFDANAMKGINEDPATTNSPKKSADASGSVKKKSANKEKFRLSEENFSKSRDIDFDGLYAHLHYRFTNPVILVNALFPLIPDRLRSAQLEYEKLEFLGDSVLALVIRERILGLLPNESRGNHSKLYDSLTQNRMLATVFMRNLDLERYLPFPGESHCEYCNVVESLVGAIYTDAGNKGLKKAKKFIMRVLDDHVLIENWRKISESGEQRGSQPRILPQLQRIISDLRADQAVDKNNVKSFLGMILAKMFEDDPEYVFHLGVGENGVPVFISRVIGAQIGKIEGCGLTRYEAEQHAARRAINFLAKEEIYPEENIIGHQSYIKFINEFSHSEYNCPPVETEIPSEIPSTFVIQLYVGNIKGEGGASSKIQAREHAARAVFEKLLAQREEVLKNSEIRRASAKHPAKVPDGPKKPPKVNKPVKQPSQRDVQAKQPSKKVPSKGPSIKGAKGAVAKNQKDKKSKL